MNRVLFALTAAALIASACVVHAMYTVENRGAWPATWPKDLEPLRKQARTLCGPQVAEMAYEIPFTNRTEFEAAWPNLVSLKSKKAPIFLERGPYTALGGNVKAGVVVHTPPIGTDKRITPEEPIPGQSNPRATWMNTTYIELIVDGDVVDLNHTNLPADTPIIDERDLQPQLPAPPATRPAGKSAAEGRPASSVK
jgi:hypothetical protein